MATNPIEVLVTVRSGRYKVGDPWPEAPVDPNPDLQLRIGPMFLRSGESTTWSFEDDDGDPTTNATSKEEHYELWRVSDVVLKAYYKLHWLIRTGGGQPAIQAAVAELQEAAKNCPQFLRRVYRCSNGPVEFHDETWPTMEALATITDRLSGDQSAEGGQAQQSQAGNGVQPQAQG